MATSIGSNSLYFGILATIALALVGLYQVATHSQEIPDDAPMSFMQISMQQSAHRAKSRAACPASPQLDGQDVSTLISSTKGMLILAIQNMRCTLAAEGALHDKGEEATTKYFTATLSNSGGGPPPYEKGASDVWDYLHGCYPNDKEGANIMHSYVFKDGKFIGQGFAAARVITGSSLGQVDFKSGRRLLSEIVSEMRRLVW